MTSKQNYIIKHASNDVLGILPEVLEELNISAQVIDITKDSLPDPETIERVWVMGSLESAYDHSVPWLERELAWLEKVQEKNIPTFGICFGSQLLARALGGQVYRNTEVEHDWVEISMPESDWQHQGPWFSFHFDAFTLPPGATLLAKSSLANQAYRRDKAWAVQFHPEINEEMFESWLSMWKESPEGLAFYESLGDLPQKLYAQIQASSQSNYANCKALMEQFLKATS